MCFCYARSGLACVSLRRRKPAFRTADGMCPLPLLSSPLPHSHLLLPMFASSVLTFTQHAHKISHVQPWYEVASDGDGLGPESVNMWKVPPKAAFVHSNTFQDPTKWNGDHTLNGKKF
jgi:hypothetical protein